MPHEHEITDAEVNRLDVGTHVLGLDLTLAAGCSTLGHVSMHGQQRSMRSFNIYQLPSPNFGQVAIIAVLLER